MSVLLDSCILVDFLSGREEARSYLAELDGIPVGRSLATRNTKAFQAGEEGIIVPYQP